MSTKHLTTTLAAALALSALSATAAQARPADGVWIGTPAKATHVVGTGTYTPVPGSKTVTAGRGPLGRTHLAPTGTTTSPAASSATVVKSGDGNSMTLVAELTGMFLLGVALIAIWVAARSGRRVHPLAH